jgi:hypothetical protein
VALERNARTVEVTRPELRNSMAGGRYGVVTRFAHPRIDAFPGYLFTDATKTSEKSSHLSQHRDVLRTGRLGVRLPAEE